LTFAGQFLLGFGELLRARRDAGFPVLRVAAAMTSNALRDLKLVSVDLADPGDDVDARSTSAIEPSSTSSASTNFAQLPCPS